MDPQRIARFIEFFVIGIVMGVTGDLIAIAVTTDVGILLQVVGIVILVSFLFAVLSDLVIDHPHSATSSNWSNMC